MRIQLNVIKADGSTEEYLHTKVMGTIGNALAHVGQADTHVAEDLAEAVTYYLYHREKQRTITSNEIFSIVKAVLTATGYEEAAIALNEHYYQRRLRRSRVEVVSVDITELADAEQLSWSDQSSARSAWDKSRITTDLTNEHDFDRQTARAIAAMVEEKIFSIGISIVPASLIKQLVFTDIAAVRRAQNQLQMA